MKIVISKIKDILEKESRVLKKYGVDHIGYRFFLSDGKSFGCPTVDMWYKIPKTDEFYKSMQEYLEKELLKLYITKRSYVTRSKEHEVNTYLKWLERIGLDNSIGIYNFGHKRVDSFFWFCRIYIYQAS